jgi:hypothetical protein
MKKGIVSPYHLGWLAGNCEDAENISEVSKTPAPDLEGLFDVTAFQAGVDEFLLVRQDAPLKSTFLADRTTFISGQGYIHHPRLIEGTFSVHLPDNWQDDNEFRPVRKLAQFLASLLEAMAHDASVLTPAGFPEAAELEVILPAPLSVPLINLLSTFKDLSVAGLVPQREVLSEDVGRFRGILQGDVFVNYTSAQSTLDNADVPTSHALPAILSSAKSVYVHKNNC